MSCCRKGHFLNKLPLYHHFHCRHKEDHLPLDSLFSKNYLTAMTLRIYSSLFPRLRNIPVFIGMFILNNFQRKKSINSGIFWWCCRHFDWGIGHDCTVSFWFSASEKCLFNTVMKNRSDYPSQWSKNVPRSPPIDWISFLLHPSLISSLFKVFALQFYLGISTY